MSTVLSVCHDGYVPELEYDRDELDVIRFVRYIAASKTS